MHRTWYKRAAVVIIALLMMMTAGADILENGSFESGPGGVLSLPSMDEVPGWRAFDTSGSNSIELVSDPTGAADGTNYIKITSVVSGSGLGDTGFDITFQGAGKVLLSTGATYTVSFDAKWVSGTDNSMTFTLRSFAEGSYAVVEDFESVSMPLNPFWTTYTYEFTPTQLPEGGDGIAFYIGFRPKAGGSLLDEVICIDNIRLDSEPVTLDLVPLTTASDGLFTTELRSGRTVWVPEQNYLYFDVPAGFGFVPGRPVYVRVEYLDAGRGYLNCQYDSSYGSEVSDKYYASELHSRSSRVDSGAFVFSCKMLESPLFEGRQNGGADFRLVLLKNDLEPFAVAGVQLSNVPFDDERFQYALSEPWLQSYDGPVHDFIDRMTLSGKVLTGYQGWFRCPNDPVDKGWVHWGRTAYDPLDASQITVDMWPYLNDYSADSVYPADEMVYENGRPAYLFSSADRETVLRHFRWMRKYNIDGAYLQRFVSRRQSGFYGADEFVLNNVREAAAREGRVWALEYDVSSLHFDDAPFEVITNDWQWLTEDLDILNDPRYLHEDGKPVLFIWGFSVPLREFTLEEANQIVDYFAAQDLYLIGGVHSMWKDNTDWYGHYQRYDQLLGWMETDLADLNSQKSTLNSWGMKILPHAWPGFSWCNLKMLAPGTSYKPRNGGQFYWDRICNAVSCGADQIFLGMFDEYDEGTAIMPMSDDHPLPHTDWGQYIDNEGNDPFWHLQLSGAAREMLHGTRSVSLSLPASGGLTEPAFGGTNLTAYLGESNTELGLAQVETADGGTVGTVAGGHDCRTNGPDPLTDFYFYFDIDDLFCVSNWQGQAVTVEIEYYDDAATKGTLFRLQYDALSGPYVRHSAVYESPGTGGWKNLRWNIADGLFAGRQNEGADFRIALSAGDSAAIRRCSVFFPEDDPAAGGMNSSVALSLSRNGAVQWPAAAEAVGWRLYATESLIASSWQEVAEISATSNNVNFYSAVHGVDQHFFSLRRSARD
ncbi:carbohydrate binding domain-containing protein [Tichowtungia aerotolerans]|uniref:CBM-cenC domain-containing protein n=1 Tax=Tichowtungia aerotolerans TaxID=2697043 RepID=A0A6P1LZP2_9BACT|nr:carbohydrate binding domain-containing protein [Tichowtungia aerotolerans]QHI68009.1 hypothetical protein GT409_00605 [Tichowtungia aerotolerans]